MIGHEQSDYYIYNADGPSLEQLPHPRPYVFYDEQVGLLSRGKSYTVVALRDDACAYFRGSSVPGEFDVCLFHSEDMVWTTKAVTVPPDQQKKNNTEEFRHSTTKVITVGGEGGAMAFVDMERGMLIYDVLSGDPMLRYIMLPQHPQQISPHQRILDHSASTARDIAIVQGSFKFVEVATIMNLASGVHDKCFDVDSWVVSSYSMRAISSQDESWSHGLKVMSTNITVDSNLSEGNSPWDIEYLLIGHPMHSLHDDVVYVMAKFDSCDSRAWIMAVDMMSGKLRDIKEFNAKRTYGFRLTYTSSRISKHLKMSPGTESELKRPGSPLLGSYSKKYFGIPLDHGAAVGAEDDAGN